MVKIKGKLRHRSLSDYGKQAMGIYSQETNLNRAVPDLIDGLKPIQRRLLWEAFRLRNAGKDGFVKTARLVGNCFSGGTPITLPGSLTKPIEEVVAGDLVQTDIGPKFVTNTFVIEDSELYEVVTDKGTVRATPDQIFYCLDSDGVEVERTPLTLKPDDRIKTFD